MAVAPFTVLMVCMGNICRSPMAERLLRLRIAERLGDGADGVVVHGAGTGAWHEGEPMHDQAAREVLARGGDPAGFQARMLTEGMLADPFAGAALTPDAVLAAGAAGAAGAAEESEVDHGAAGEVATEASGADLILTATIEQARFVAELVPCAGARAFVLGQFARLAERVDAAELPPPGASPAALAARGRALVAAADRLRDDAHRSDEVPDPWGRTPKYFSAVADQIDDAVTRLADRLAG